jgi:predicted RNA-binding Zn-ribbon protein involved in translation (DUF1610 family)
MALLSALKMNYYYSTDGSEVAGPYSLGELTSLFATGTLPTTTQICCEGQQTWQPISSVIETAPARSTRDAVTAEIAQSQRSRASLPSASTAGVSATKPCPMCGEQILATAKKCKHCGEYLDASLRATAKPTKEPPDALGVVIMLLPLASAALMWFWISSMNLLQNPSSTLAGIAIVTVIVTAALMAVEASRLGMGGKRDGKATTGPAGWFLCGLGIWIIAFPAYLYWRSKFGVKNYVVGGLVSALIFYAVAFGLAFAIEQQKSELRRHFDDLQRQIQSFSPQ